MKKTLLLLTVNLITVICFSQTIFINGSAFSGRPGASSSGDTLNPVKIKCQYEFRQKVNAKDSAGFTIDTLLLEMGDRYSKWYDRTRAMRDSVFNKSMSNMMGGQIKSVNVKKGDDFGDFSVQGGNTLVNENRGETARIYKDRADGEITTIDGSGSDIYRCRETKVSQEWEILPETEPVLGYECNKATAKFRGREYVVWFSPEIPVNDGPWKLYGLPGLILKAETTDHLFAFKAIGLEKSATGSFIVVPKGKFINCSRDQLYNLSQKQKGVKTAFSANGGNITILTSNGTGSKFEKIELE